jgi:hypothetical protein
LTLCQSAAQVEKLTKECDTLRTKLDEMVANNLTCVR